MWGLFKQNISLKQIVDSGYVLCWAAKWYGSDEIHFDSIHRSKPKKMLKGIHKLLEEADAVVHYNGTSFDVPTLNKEFLLNRMLPPATYRQIDLLLTARNRFRFASNKLDYVAQALGVGKKTKHVGFELWVQCMAGNDDAWATMEEYNKNDVVLLEEVYEILLPWIKNHPNVGLYAATEHTCPTCGSGEVTRRGFSFTAMGKYQRYQCNACGHWSRDRKVIKTNVTLVTDQS